MAEIVNSLFGTSPADLLAERNRRDYLDTLAVARQSAAPGTMMSPSLAPFYQEAAQTGQLIGKGVGAIAGLFGVEDPEMRKLRDVADLRKDFDLNTTEGIRQYAAALNAKGYGDFALAANRIADEKGLIEAKTTAQQAKAIASLRPKEVNPETRAEQDYAAAVYARYPDTVEGRAAAANEFAEWKNKRKKEVAAAGVAPGEAKIPDLRTAQSIVNDYLGKSKESLSTIKTINNYGEMIKAGNSSQLPQFQRALVKLVGDSQIGQNELKNILGSGGIAADIVDGVTKFMTGAPSNAKIDDVLKGVKVLERQVQESYRSGQDQARRVLTNSKFDPKIVDDLVGPALKTTTTPKAAPPVGTVMNGYKFNGGNPADPKSWSKVTAPQ